MKLRLRNSLQTNHLRTAGSLLGFTLLEVLIALLVLSIGLVGAAVLMVQSLQNTHSSLHTSLASAAALDFEERLWVDLGRIEADCPAANIGGFVSDFVSEWSATPERLGLPKLDDTQDSTLGLTITNDTNPNPSIRRLGFTLTWQEDRFGTGTESFAYETRLPCRPGP